MEYTHHASVWYPVAGLTFASLLLLGFSILPALLTGCVLVTFYTAQHYQITLDELQLLKAGLLFGLAHILPYGNRCNCAAHTGQTRRARYQPDHRTVFSDRRRQFVLCDWLVIPTLVATDMMSQAEITATWLPFWIGDMAGVMVLAPFFVGLLSRVMPSALFRLTDLAGLKQQQFSSKYLMKLLLNALLLTFCMLLAKVTDSPNSAFAIFFLVIPHMWIACSESALPECQQCCLIKFPDCILGASFWFDGLCDGLSIRH